MPNAPDAVRAQKINELQAYTNRNVICYYSGWLNVNGASVPNLSIDDMDKNGFMNAVQGMDCSLGLDLVLHSPGGSVTAAESLVYYLKKKFGNDIRVIIPQMAMSAGTMIACCSKEIVMGNQSCIGPFDPSVRNVSAFAVFDEFVRASEDIKVNPHNVPLWQTMISKYPPAFLEECERAIELANTIVPKWLRENMLSGDTEGEQERKISELLSALNNPDKTKEHSRHIHIEEATELGLNVTQLESDQALQEKVLTLHHAYLATLMMTNTSKLIESHHGKKFILSYQG
ncbi:S49 family peptidase [Vibrio sp. F12]|nr:S49 family peptidase [Vibrio sp. F12]